MADGNAARGLTPFSPLAGAVMDRFEEGLILFDLDGRVSYANRAGRRVLDRVAGGDGLDARSMLLRLGRMGGRMERLEAGTVVLGHAMYLPASSNDTLATRERRAIVETLQATGWRLTETARRLGISRTTLWRRLRDYGVHVADEGLEPGEAAAAGK